MTFSIISDGTEYSLEDRDIAIIDGIDGLGIPSILRFIQKGAQQHGGTDNGFLLEPRKVRMSLRIFPASFSDYFTKRDFLVALFSPENDPVFRITQPNGDKRDLNVVYDSDFSLPVTADNWASEKFVLSLLAPNPAYYDPEPGAVSYNIGGSAGDLGEIPMAVPEKIGGSDIDTSTVINYHGTWREYPIIRIYGPITDVIIENSSTGDKLDFTGYSIGSSDYIYIDTAFGVKSVILNGTTIDDGTNIIDKLSDDSDLLSFHLEPRKANETYHANSIRVQGIEINVDTKIEIAYQERYLGV
jgi:hypothetical protein